MECGFNECCITPRSPRSIQLGLRGAVGVGARMPSSVGLKLLGFRTSLHALKITEDPKKLLFTQSISFKKCIKKKYINKFSYKEADKYIFLL